MYINSNLPQKEEVFGLLPESILRPVTMQKEIVYNSNAEFVEPNYALYNLFIEDEFANPTKIGGQVSKDYPLTQHKDFFGNVQGVLLENINPEIVIGENAVDVKTKVAHNGAFVLQEYVFNNLKTTLTNPKRDVEIAYRVIVWHGLGGIASNNFRAGAIEFYCTNGMITGEFNAVTMKNTKNFELANFISELQNATVNFTVQAEQYQKELDTEIAYKDAQKFIETITKHDFSKDIERKRQTKTLAHNLLEQITEEIRDRGSNVYAVRSALTNWSTHGETRKTSIDHEAKTMLEREQKVTTWTNSDAFKELSLVA